MKTGIVDDSGFMRLVLKKIISTAYILFILVRQKKSADDRFLDSLLLD